MDLFRPLLLQFRSWLFISILLHVARRVEKVQVAAARTLRPDEDALGDCDLVHAEARARPAAYILQAKLSNPFFRFSPADFTGWFCFQFRIPQTAHLGNANAAGVEQCLGSCRRRDVDLHGNHAHAPCKVCKLGRGHRHRDLKYVVSHHAAKAGCLVTRVKEASTPELLENEFTPEECSKMFPLEASAALAEGARQVLVDLRSVATLPAGQREAKAGRARRAAARPTELGGGRARAAPGRHHPGPHVG